MTQRRDFKSARREVRIKYFIVLSGATLERPEKISPKDGEIETLWGCAPGKKFFSRRQIAGR